MRTVFPLGLILLVACALGGCASDNTSATFYKAEAGYTAVLQAAASYVSLPRCVDSGPAVCSKQAIVDQIRPAANSADATIQAAEDTIRNHPTVDASFAIAAAQNASQALAVILEQYAIGPK